MSKHPSQAEFIMSFFEKHPNQPLEYDEWTDALASEYKALTGYVARHFRSVARRLAGEGKLTKVKSGVYLYDPNVVPKLKLGTFSRKQKRQIRERDGYRCVVCGMGKRESVTLYVDFIFQYKTNRAESIDNGATYCRRHMPRKFVSFVDKSLFLTNLIVITLKKRFRNPPI